jgi:hypothetical protein
MKHETKRLAGAALCALLVGAAAFTPAHGEDRLTPLLHFVPADVAEAGDPSNAVQFVDLAAIRSAIGDLLVDSNASNVDRVFFAARRIVDAPVMFAPFVDRFTQVSGALPEYFGFAWSDIDRVAGFVSTEGRALIVVGGPPVTDSDTLEAALTGREWDPYQTETRDGFTAWWRFEDDTMDPRRADPSDIFGGALGGAARISVVDGALVGTTSWARLEQVIAAAIGGGRSSDESVDLAALIHAIDQPVHDAGAVFQVQMFSGGDDAAYMLGEAAEIPERLAEGEALVAEAGAANGTPPYLAVAFAERQEGEMAIAVIALAFADRADAELAAMTVPDAVESRQTQRGRPIQEFLPFDIATDIVDSPDGDRFVARIAFTAPIDVASGPDMGADAVPYRILHSRLVSTRDIALLLATTEH